MLTVKPRVTAEHRREAAASMKEMGAEAYLKGPLQRWWATRSLARTIAEQEEIDKLPYSVAMRRAAECEARFDWKGAGENYLLAAEEAGDDEPGWRAHAFSYLATLCDALDREDEALHYAHVATTLERAREAMTLPITLHSEILLLVEASHFEEARQVIDELFALLAKHTIHPVQTVQAHLARARYFLGLKEYENAEEDLAVAWQIMEPYQKGEAGGGYIGVLAAGFALRACLCSVHKDDVGAMDAMRECVQKRRTIAALPHINGMGKYDNLAFALNQLGRAQRAAGDPRASEAFEESRSIRRSIGLSPLESVPENHA